VLVRIKRNGQNLPKELRPSDELFSNDWSNCKFSADNLFETVIDAKWSNNDFAKLIAPLKPTLITNATRKIYTTWFITLLVEKT